MHIFTPTLVTLAFIFSHAAATDEPVLLFNGKDLSGWTGANYEVKQGEMICRGGNLRTVKSYTNYVLEFEFLLPPGGNNGLGIHYPGKGTPSGTGMELQILDTEHPKYKKIKEYQVHGALYGFQGAKRGFLKPTGEWNRQIVTVNGPHVTVDLNGTRILDVNLEEQARKKPKHKGIHRRSGFICLCGHGDPVRFKNIRILELPDKTEGSK